MTGGKYYNVRRTTDLEQALTDINQVEKGVFYMLSLTRNEPAYFIFVTLALICLALRVVLHAVPQFVEISSRAPTSSWLIVSPRSICARPMFAY